MMNFYITFDLYLRSIIIWFSKVMLYHMISTFNHKLWIKYLLNNVQKCTSAMNMFSSCNVVRVNFKSPVYKKSDLPLTDIKINNFRGRFIVPHHPYVVNQCGVITWILGSISCNNILSLPIFINSTYAISACHH